MSSIVTLCPSLEDKLTLEWKVNYTKWGSNISEIILKK